MTEIKKIVTDAVAAGLPATFTVPLPTTGDYKLKDLRALCQEHGAVRFSPWAVDDRLRGLTCIIDGANELPLVALAMIVRDDTIGLERAIISCIDQVDEIVIAVDGRSNEDTQKVAAAYADTLLVFKAADIGLSDEEWAADRIHFAKARNFGREQVHAQWTLVIDADEMFATNVELRPLMRDLDPEVAAFTVAIGSSTFEQRDVQRLARTHFRYFSATHNQLPITGKIEDADVFITMDVSLRSAEERDRRTAQRNHGILELLEAGKKGDLSALFHAAKHYIGVRDEQGVALIEEYRLRTEIHGLLAAERVWLALSAAAFYHERDDLRRAEQWAVRALLDGPRLEAFSMLGDMAEEEGDLPRARAWYECACMMEPETSKFLLTSEIEQRFARRDGLRQVLQERSKMGNRRLG